nr:hypothetical protein [uncultured Butyrivibrio sp.]
MFTLVFLPLILVGLVFKGLVAFALPVLLVVGLFTLLDRDGKPGISPVENRLCTIYDDILE